jgi:Na+-translocating ferredoxin:NAD+ oxidoreductase RnfG subunit
MVKKQLNQSAYPNLNKIKLISSPLSQYLSSSKIKFDAIVHQLGTPKSAHSNRYYQPDFFSLLKSHLTDAGILSVSFICGENHINQEQQRIGASLYKNLKKSFKRLSLKPGQNSLFIASDSKSVTLNRKVILKQYREAPGAQSILPIKTLLNLFNMQRIKQQIGKYRGWLLKNDKQLEASKSNFILQSMLMESSVAGVSLSDFFSHIQGAGVFLILMIPILLFIFRIFWLNTSLRSREHEEIFFTFSTVAVTGFIACSTTLCLLFEFQTRFGSLQLFVGNLSACYMLGLCLSFFIHRKFLRDNCFETGLLLTQALFMGLLYHHLQSISSLTFFIFMIASGVLNGLWFPYTFEKLNQGSSPALSWFFDSIGATLACLIGGIIAIPLYGTQAVLQLCFISATCLLLSFYLISDKHGRLKKDKHHVLKAVGFICFIPILLFYSSHALKRIHNQNSAISLFKSAISKEIPPKAKMKRLNLGSKKNLMYYELPDKNFIFSTSSLTKNIQGYGGHLELTLKVDDKGVLKGLNIYNSNETPSYIDFTKKWRDSLLGKNITNPKELEIDMVTGATMTCSAVKQSIQQAGPIFGKEVLKLETKIQNQARKSFEIDIKVIGFFILFVFLFIIRRHPKKQFRLLMLTATALGLGYGLNFQFSLADVHSIMEWKFSVSYFSASGLMLIGIPVLVMLFGNVYCGWLCPFGALQELIGELLPDRLKLNPSKPVWKWTRKLKYLVLIILLSLLGFSGNPEYLNMDPLITFFSQIKDKPMFWFSITLLAISLVSPRFWCRMLCPTGAFLSIIGQLKPLNEQTGPLPKFGKCDIGVGHFKEFDCMYCDRCRNK